ncbi:hypothetical protein MMC25_002218 [Agyrium rufum]|nr:hypothetical protein [Agyrium rufum]
MERIFKLLDKGPTNSRAWAECLNVEEKLIETGYLGIRPKQQTLLAATIVKIFRTGLRYRASGVQESCIWQLQFLGLENYPSTFVKTIYDIVDGLDYRTIQSTAVGIWIKAHLGEAVAKMSPSKLPTMSPSATVPGWVHEIITRSLQKPNIQSEGLGTELGQNKDGEESTQPPHGHRGKIFQSLGEIHKKLQELEISTIETMTNIEKEVKNSSRQAAAFRKLFSPRISDDSETTSTTGETILTPVTLSGTSSIADEHELQDGSSVTSNPGSKVISQQPNDKFSATVTLNGIKTSVMTITFKNDQAEQSHEVHKEISSKKETDEKSTVNNGEKQQEFDAQDNSTMLTKCNTRHIVNNNNGLPSRGDWHPQSIRSRYVPPFMRVIHGVDGEQ